MSSTLEVELFLHYCSLTNIFQQRELQVFHNYYYGFSLLPPCLSQRQWSEVAQWCLTLCDPTDCSLPGSSVHGIFQAIVLELIAISFSRGSSWPRDWTWVSCIAGRFFTIWAIAKSRKESPRNVSDNTVFEAEGIYPPEVSILES